MKEPLIVLTRIGIYANNEWYINEIEQQLYVKDRSGSYLPVTGNNTEKIIAEAVSNESLEELLND